MLSEKIYTLRRKSGLSQEQLAEKIGVSRQAISKWEGGLSIPELEKIRALSEFFNVSIDELTREQETDNPSDDTEEKQNRFFLMLDRRSMSDSFRRNYDDTSIFRRAAE